MSNLTTVIFADLAGSTAAFESLGNATATRAITRLTDWMKQVCIAHKGRVVKTLGDGVLVVFADGYSAVQASIEMQRKHTKRLDSWPAALRLKLRVGLAAGEVMEVDDDCYGDAVNLASRLSDMSGPEQIWATDTVIKQLPPETRIRYRSLGAVAIRGMVGTRLVYRVEWQDEIESEQLTMPAILPRPSGVASLTGAVTRVYVELQRGDLLVRFHVNDLPVHLGRVQEAQFMVKDPRASRLHARIEWRSGVFVLTDVSSYGTWVRFAGSNTVLALRRTECVLTGDGEIALGGNFADPHVPTVNFRLI